MALSEAEKRRKEELDKKYLGASDLWGGRLALFLIVGVAGFVAFQLGKEYLPDFHAALARSREIIPPVDLSQTPELPTVPTESKVPPTPEAIVKAHTGPDPAPLAQIETPVVNTPPNTETMTLRGDVALIGNPTVEDVMRYYSPENMREAGWSQEKIDAWGRIARYLHNNQTDLRIGAIRPKVRLAEFFAQIPR